MKRSYRTPPPPPEWYPAKIHKRVLSLDEWAEEMSFRRSIKRDVEHRRKRINEEGKYSPRDWYKDVDSERFIKHMDNKAARCGVMNLGVDMGEPIEYIPKHDHIEDEYSLNTTNSLHRGFFLPIAVNIAYDDKTLKIAFDKFLNDCRQTYERETFGNGLRSTAYGKKPYIEADTKAWYAQKVLDWIDINFWCYLTGANINQPEIVEMIGVSDSSMGNTLKKREKELFSGMGIFRLRASAKLLRENAPDSAE